MNTQIYCQPMKVKDIEESIKLKFSTVKGNFALAYKERLHPNLNKYEPISYTHQTLPTICNVNI